MSNPTMAPTTVDPARRDAEELTAIPTTMAEERGDRASERGDETRGGENEERAQAKESRRPNCPTTKSFSGARDSKAMEDRRRTEEGDHEGGVHSSQNDAQSVSSDSSDEDLAPIRFQTQFADLVKEVTGTDEYRANIIGALTKLNAHHEAMTETVAMTAAMESNESVMVAFGGIRRSKVVAAIMRIMATIKINKEAWEAKNPIRSSEWEIDGKFVSMFHVGVAGGGPGLITSARGGPGAAGGGGGGSGEAGAARGGPGASTEMAAAANASGATSGVVGLTGTEGKSIVDAQV